MRNIRNKKLKALVVGYGSVGRRHAENLHALGVGKILFLRHKASGKMPSGHITSFSKVLAAGPDFAIIANPTSLHIPIALRLAKAGIHLFIEKPLSGSENGVGELIRIAKDKKLVTMVGYNFRFHPQLIKIKKMVEAGTIGRILCGRVSAGQYLPDWHPDEDYKRGYAARKDLGGGVILTLIHEIDYLSWIMGETKSVFCLADKISKLEIDVEDVAEIIIKYGNGAVGEVHLDYLQRVPRRSLEIIGEKGTILWDYFDGVIKLFTAKNKKWSVHKISKDFDRNLMFMEEMKHFLDCVLKRKETDIPLSEGAKSLKVALAAKRSSASGKVVNL